jgi:hypothetical protein
MIIKRIPESIKNQNEPGSGIRAGFAVLLACFFSIYKPQNT